MNDSQERPTSLRLRSSPFKRERDGRGCITCICPLFPAVMLEMVQHASFRIDSLALLRRCSRQGRAEQFSTTCHARTNLLVADSSGKREVALCGPSGGFRGAAFFFCSHLCLNVISSDDVSDGSQCGRGDLVVGVPVEKRRLSVSLCVRVYADGRGRAYMSSSTRRLQTPESMTAWILSLGPSER